MIVFDVNISQENITGKLRTLKKKVTKNGEKNQEQHFIPMYLFQRFPYFSTIIFSLSVSEQLAFTCCRAYRKNAED